jgi:small GTP-binding protein
MGEYKIVMIGESGVGKTSMVDRFYSNTYNSSVPPTIGAAYVKVALQLVGRPVVLNIWDTAGQERFQSLVPLYMRSAHGLVFVFDIMSLAAIRGLNAVFESIKDQLVEDMQLMLCANKIDLLDAHPNLAAESDWAKEHNMELVETSALTGQGVNDLFKRLAIRIMRHRVRDKKSNAEDILKGDISDPDRMHCC